MNNNELREHQLRAVDAMKIVDSICKKYNIKYFMIAGSALGAVRHQGFIPWDDDIDIAMTMDQYFQFIEVAPACFSYPYTWKNTYVDNYYPTLSSGVYYGDAEPLITVFPLVKLSDNPIQRKIQWIIRKVMSPVWQRKVKYSIPKDKLNPKQVISFLVSSFLSLFLSKRQVLRILRNNEIRYEDRDVEWYCNIYSKYSQEKESIKSEWLDRVKYVPFEDSVFPILHEYDLYLSHLYGDYMIPPEMNLRVPEHYRNEK